MGFKDSLAGKMFGTVAEGLGDVAKSLGLEQEEQAAAAASSSSTKTTGAEELVADIDTRAQSGDLTFKDFMAMSEAFMKMDGSMPGVAGKLSAAQISETREKIEKHQKIVDVMVEDELNDPQLLIEDLKAGGSKPGPRLQRLAVASGEPETEVALFVMQFEAMRESTRRIAAGEDPDKVTESMSAPPGSNRAARRAAKRSKVKKEKSK